MEAFVVLLAFAVLLHWILQSREAGKLETRQEALQNELRKVREEVSRLQLRLDAIRDAQPAPVVESPSPPQPKPETKPAPEPAAPPLKPLPEVKVAANIQLQQQPMPSTTLPPAPPSDAPPPRKPPQQPPVPPPPPDRRFDWEALVGVKLFSWIAGIALVIAAVFFLKYSVDHGWLGPAVRMAIGLITGTALLVVCEWKAARRYAVTANALDAAGIAMLFSTFYASHVLWNLLGTIPTFIAMALVTAVAVLLSIRHDSLFIAVLGLIGGFATPALLSTGEDRPIGLFSYLLLLNAGIAWVAYRKRWPHLTTACAVLTALYQWGWVFKFMRPDRVPLAMGVFLLFPVVSYFSLALGERRDLGGNRSMFEMSTMGSVVLPLVFALFLAGNASYGYHYGLLFGFLFLIDAGLAVIAAKRGPEWLHLFAGILTVAVFCIWLAASYRHEAWPALLGIVSLFILLYLAADWIGSGFQAEGRKAVLTAPLLLIVFPVLAQIEPSTASPAVLFVALFVLMTLLASFAIWKERGPIHYLGSFFALAAEAVWSARNLDSSRLIAGLSIYAVFGLFYLGVPFAARRWQRRLQPAGSSVFVLFASLGLLFFLAAGPAAESALWGIGLLLVILNLGLLVESSLRQHRNFVVAGFAVSWLVIALWWWTVPLAAHLVSGLVMIAGFAVMVLASSLWATRHAPEEDQAGPVQGMYLALAGHAFLFFVALQQSLAVPPWPFLAVMGVLDLAIGVACLYSRRAETLLAALSASQIILIAWQFTAVVSPWPTVAAGCAVSLAVFGFVWYFLGQRQIGFARASLGSSGLACGIILTGVTLSSSPGVSLLSSAMVLLLTLILAMGWLARWRMVAPLSVALAGLVLLSWSAYQFKSELWLSELLFAAAIYAVYLGYPMILGDRPGTQLEPYLAAVLASVVFFLLADMR
jgi:hypothetical protein